MKSTSFFLFLMLISSLAQSQNFGPIGANWYYTEKYPFSGNVDFLKVTSVLDTVYQGKTCHKLEKNSILECGNRPYIEYIYTEDSVVYFWDNDFNSFQILYDFKAKVDSSWYIRIKGWGTLIDSIKVKVDSIGFTNINNHTCKVLYVTYFEIYHFGFTGNFYHSTIIESLGDLSYMFNFFPFTYLTCDLNYSDGLRCYEDNEMGLYSTGIADSCTYKYLSSGLEENSSEDGFTVYPNPSEGNFYVETGSVDLISIEICNLTGQLLYSKYFRSSTQIDLIGFPKGIYIIKLKSEDRLIGNRKIAIN